MHGSSYLCNESFIITSKSFKRYAQVIFIRSYGNVRSKLDTAVLRIWEVPDSNLDLETYLLNETFYSFPHSLRENSGIVP
jgi:hypothetical protein